MKTLPKQAMSEKKQPSKPSESSYADCIAAMLQGRGETKSNGTSLQTTHRFLIPALFIIENMAETAKKKRSEMINFVIEAGLDAIKRTMQQEEFHRFNHLSDEQTQRLMNAYPTFTPLMEQIVIARGVNR